MYFISTNIYTVAEQAVNLPQVNPELQDQRAIDRQGKLQNLCIQAIGTFVCHVSLHVSYNIAAGPPEPAPDAGSAQNPQLDQSPAEVAN